MDGRTSWALLSKMEPKVWMNPAVPSHRNCFYPRYYNWTMERGRRDHVDERSITLHTWMEPLEQRCSFHREEERDGNASTSGVL